jgi:hypothetical protein
MSDSDRRLPIALSADCCLGALRYALRKLSNEIAKIEELESEKHGCPPPPAPDQVAQTAMPMNRARVLKSKFQGRPSPSQVTMK